MKRSSYLSKLQIGLATLVAVLAAGCGKEASLVPLVHEFFHPVNADTAEAKAEVCAADPMKFGTTTKFFFNIDISGSNMRTDPPRSLRFDSILNFLNSIPPGQDAYFGYLVFNGQAVFRSDFTDINTFRSLIQQEKTYRDAGETNFVDSFTLDGSVIYQDIQRTMDKLKSQPKAVVPMKTQYVIFHISDGRPTLQTDLQIQLAVQNLMYLQTGQFAQYVDSITVNTAYYTDAADNDPVAKALMQNIALWGNGKALDFQTGDTIHFQDFAKPVVHLPLAISEIYVRNINTVWWNNQLMKDSDGDQLPDEYEIQIGSNPYDADTDGDGISDWVQWQKNGHVVACKSLPCAVDPQAQPLNACQQFYLGKSSDGHILYSDDDLDGFNSCEESQYLGTDPLNFDSNLDGVPDWIEAVSGVDYIKGQDNLHEDLDNDGLDNFTELKIFTPVDVNDNELTGLKPYEYHTEPYTGPNGENCYHVDVSNISTIGPNNHVRIYVVDKSTSAPDIRIMRTLEKPVDSNGTVSFSLDELSKAPMSRYDNNQLPIGPN